MIDDYEAKYIERIIELTTNGKMEWYEYEEENHGDDEYSVFNKKSYKCNCRYNTTESIKVNGNRELITVPYIAYFVITMTPTNYTLTNTFYKTSNTSEYDRTVSFNIESDNETTMEYKILKRLYDVVATCVDKRNKSLKVQNIFAFLSNFK